MKDDFLTEVYSIPVPINNRMNLFILYIIDSIYIMDIIQLVHYLYQFGRNQMIKSKKFNT